MREYRVLAIDGGGIRGVIPGVLLKYIEEKAQKPISEMFDLVAGTSTGGILGVGLTMPNQDDTGPQNSAAKMLDLYLNHGHEIFDRSIFQRLRSVDGVFDERYGHARLEALLKEYLGETLLSETRLPVLVPSYDIQKPGPYFFKSHRAKKKEPGREHYLWQVARSTSAAPTYFEAASITSLGSEPVARTLVDGGVFCNNPALAAYTEAETLREPDQEISVISLGTGTNTKPLPYERAKNWGMAEWAVPIISVMMDGQARSAAYQLENVLKRDKRYFRYDIDLSLNEKASAEMDNASEENLDALQELAGQMIKVNQRSLDALIEKLTR